MLRVGLLAICLATPAFAETQVQNLTYTCDRGVAVPVVYVNATDTSLAVIYVEGGQYLLYNEPAASGARYGWPSGGSGYIWWTKGEEASLYWKNGEAGTETILLTGCKPR